MGVELDHLGIAVRDVAESLAFYEKILGMTVSTRETVEAERVNIAMLPAGSTSGAPRVELLEGTDEDSPVAKFIQSRGPGLHHIALRVDDLEAVVGKLKQEGCVVLNELRTGAGGQQYVFVHPRSTGGVLLELIQNKVGKG